MKHNYCIMIRNKQSSRGNTTYLETLNKAWDSKGLNSFYRDVFLFYIRRLPPSVAEEQTHKEIIKTHNQTSSLLKLQESFKRRERLVALLRPLTSDGQLSQLCMHVSTLRQLNLLICEQILALNQKINVDDQIIAFNYLKLFKSLDQDLEFLKEGQLNKYITFSQGFDPFLIVPFNSFAKGTQKSIDKPYTVSSLFDLDTNLLFRIIKTMHSVEQFKNKITKQYPLQHDFQQQSTTTEIKNQLQIRKIKPRLLQIRRRHQNTQTCSQIEQPDTPNKSILTQPLKYRKKNNQRLLTQSPLLQYNKGSKQKFKLRSLPKVNFNNTQSDDQRKRRMGIIRKNFPSIDKSTSVHFDQGYFATNPQKVTSQINSKSMPMNPKLNQRRFLHRRRYQPNQSEENSVNESMEVNPLPKPMCILNSLVEDTHEKRSHLVFTEELKSILERRQQQNSDALVKELRMQQKVVHGKKVWINKQLKKNSVRKQGLSIERQINANTRQKQLKQTHVQQQSNVDIKNKTYNSQISDNLSDERGFNSKKMLISKHFKRVIQSEPQSPNYIQHNPDKIRILNLQTEKHEYIHPEIKPNQNKGEIRNKEQTNVESNQRNIRNNKAYNIQDGQQIEDQIRIKMNKKSYNPKQDSQLIKDKIKMEMNHLQQQEIERQRQINLQERNEHFHNLYGVQSEENIYVTFGKGHEGHKNIACQNECTINQYKINKKFEADNNFTPLTNRRNMIRNINTDTDQLNNFHFDKHKQIINESQLNSERNNRQKHHIEEKKTNQFRQQIKGTNQQGYISEKLMKHYPGIRFVQQEQHYYDQKSGQLVHDADFVHFGSGSVPQAHNSSNNKTLLKQSLTPNAKNLIQTKNHININEFDQNIDKFKETENRKQSQAAILRNITIEQQKSSINLHHLFTDPTKSKAESIINFINNNSLKEEDLNLQKEERSKVLNQFLIGDTHCRQTNEIINQKINQNTKKNTSKNTNNQQHQNHVNSKKEIQSNANYDIPIKSDKEMLNNQVQQKEDQSNFLIMQKKQYEKQGMTVLNQQKTNLNELNSPSSFSHPQKYIFQSHKRNESKNVVYNKLDIQNQRDVKQSQNYCNSQPHNFVKEQINESKQSNQLKNKQIHKLETIQQQKQLQKVSNSEQKKQQLQTIHYEQIKKNQNNEQFQTDSHCQLINKDQQFQQIKQKKQIQQINEIFRLDSFQQNCLAERNQVPNFNKQQIINSQKQKPKQLQKELILEYQFNPSYQRNKFANKNDKDEHITVNQHNLHENLNNNNPFSNIKSSQLSGLNQLNHHEQLKKQPNSLTQIRTTSRYNINLEFFPKAIPDLYQNNDKSNKDDLVTNINPKIQLNSFQNNQIKANKQLNEQINSKIDTDQTKNIESLPHTTINSHNYSTQFNDPQHITNLRQQRTQLQEQKQQMNKNVAQQPNKLTPLQTEYQKQVKQTQNMPQQSVFQQKQKHESVPNTENKETKKQNQDQKNIEGRESVASAANKSDIKKQIRLKISSKTLKQFFQSLDKLNIHSYYQNLFDLNKLKQDATKSQLYCFQLRRSDSTLLILVICEALPNGQITIRLWAPTQESDSPTASKSFFNKFLQYLEKSTACEKIHYAGKYIAQMGRSFTAISDGHYVRKRKQPSRKPRLDYPQFVSWECIQVRFQQSQNQPMLVSNQIESFNDYNYYCIDAITSGGIDVPAQLLTIFKQDMNLSNFQKVNSMLQQDGFQSFGDSGDLPAFSIDLFRFKYSSAITTHFLSSGGYLQFPATVVKEGSTHLATLKLQKSKGSVHFGSGFKNVQEFVDAVNDEKQGAQKNVTVKNFNKMLYGMMKKGHYGSWEVNFGWKDELQGSLRHELKKEICFEPPLFHCALNFAGRVITAFTVSDADCQQ